MFKDGLRNVTGLKKKNISFLFNFKHSFFSSPWKMFMLNFQTDTCLTLFYIMVSMRMLVGNFECLSGNTF